MDIMIKSGKKKSLVIKASFHRKLFYVLLMMVFLLGTLSLAKATGLLIPSQPEVLVQDKIISLDSLTLEQKIAQMVVVSGSLSNLKAWKKMQLGGIHLFAMAKEDLFRDKIIRFQEGMSLPFFVTIDLEGCQNPFAAFHNFTAASDVATEGIAFEKGSYEGKYLSSLGVTINFAPVVDLQDTIWKCRSYPGGSRQIADLSEAYVLGLQKEDVVATAKHYPGKTLVVQDPHKFLVAADISSDDVYPYSQLKSSVKAVMVSHIIASGAVDSRGIPSVVSPVVINTIRSQYDGLIITDEINMLGLKNFYKSDEEMYLAVFNAGSDIILNFNEDPNQIYRMIQVVSQAVDNGEISETRIDDSVRRILMAKGFIVE